MSFSVSSKQCSWRLLFVFAGVLSSWTRLASAQDAGAAPTQVLITEGKSDRGAVSGRASSRVDREELDERLPRSAPDALRHEPGVYVQQSAHGQGSPYVRGRTGQQTLVLYDGIRMNTSTWRQGPNQYFFTVDSKTIERIEITRGGGSTLHGSDAIAGVIDAHPIEPRLDLQASAPQVRPRSSLRWASADNDFANRFQVDTQVNRRVRFLLGLGWRSAGQLEGGGIVRNPQGNGVPQVPRLEDDGRTQLGTGFNELTGDGRFVLGLGGGRRLVAAFYGYRQFDSPRTDQCPAAFAPRDECLRYDEQFRSLAYVSHEGRLGVFAAESQLSLSYQRQHERRTLERPRSFVENGGRDTVNTFGLTLKLTTAALEPFEDAQLRVRYGGDVFHDSVSSAAWTSFTDIGAVIPSTRGQYLDGSTYLQGGAFAESEWTFLQKLVLRGGARLVAARASAPEDAESGTLPVDQGWTAAVGNVGAEYQFLPELAVLATYDRSLRAPNLDDLTSRQQTGPGFQFENARLEPETADTYEAGLRVTHSRLELDAWVFRSVVRDAITRSFRSAPQCPPQTPQCELAWQRYQLVNVSGSSTIDGFELSLRGLLPARVTIRGTLSYAFGSGPNPEPRPANPTLAYDARVPLSRVPPLNGTGDLRWGFFPEAYVGAAVRWASKQDRLAPTDFNDARIPLGGTPGYTVFDLRVGYRMRRNLILAAVVENVADVPYRVHGSSVNGPGRGVILAVEAGL